MLLFHSSSVVEQSAVNRSVAGSNPACGAMESCPSWPKEHDWKSCRPFTRPRGFESLALRHLFWPVGQAVKTPPFHGGNTGSSPVRVTIIFSVSRWRMTIRPDHQLVRWRISSAGRASALQAGGRRFEPYILHHITSDL